MLQADEPIAAQEEVKSDVVSEEVKVEQPEPEVEMTFGFPNSVLIENEIDPQMLYELPEDMRVELLSTINW
jgi:hypothetical protein